MDWFTYQQSTLKMQGFGLVWCNNFFKKKRKKVKKRKENLALAARDKMQGCPVNMGILLIKTVQWGTCIVLAFFPSCTNCSSKFEDYNA
jgi:hypothetical protein